MCILLSLCGIGLFVYDYVAFSAHPIVELVRKSYGGGDVKKEMLLEIEGMKGREEVDVNIQERIYAAKEIGPIFDQCFAQMDQWILGRNDSLGHVEYDLNLIAQIPDESIRVDWESSNYAVIGSDGTIKPEELDMEGILVNLTATLTYEKEESLQASYNFPVMVYPRTLVGKEKVLEAVRSDIKQADENSRTEKAIVLPEESDKKKIHFYEKLDSRGIVLAVMGMLCLILIYALDLQNQKQKKDQRKKNLQAEYPEIVSKLTLLVGAGMTVKNAFRRIVADYERTATSGQEEDFPAYEEMKRARNEMESGVLEAECYEHFGKRCGEPAYMRLGALLSQNLRKGTKGLNDLLRMEVIQAFEERKARAKRLGEETGTKLLLPMFLMLAEVLFIVIVPAFLSMQI